MAHVSMTVNGKVRKGDVEPRLLLVHFLREQLLLTGAHVGCDTSQCGACTVLIDGRSAKSCTIFAVQADGSDITTIEGLAKDGQLHPVQEGFWQEHGLQCGLLHAGHDHVGGQPPERDAAADRAADPRRHLGQLLPLHRLPAHRQRHPARGKHEYEQAREQEVVHGTHSCPAEARRRAREAPRGPAPDSGARHLRGRRQDRRHAAPGVQAQRRRSRPHPLDRHARRRGDGRRRGGVHRRADRRAARADADRHALPLAAASRRRDRHGPLRGRAGGCGRGEQPLYGARRRGRDRGRHRAAARRSSIQSWR